MLLSKQKLKINILVFVAVVAILVIIGIVPLLSSFFKNSKDLDAKNKSAYSLDQQIAALKDFQANNNIYQQSVQKLKSSFVFGEAPIEFIEFLEAEAIRQGLDIDITSVKDSSEKKANRLTMAFQVSLSGDFPDVLGFIKRLEQSPWLLKIDQASIQRLGDKEKAYNFQETKPGEVVLTLSFKAFSNYLGTASNNNEKN